MKTSHHRRGPAIHKWQVAAAALAFVLSIFAAPAASAEPLEGDMPGTSTASIESETKWPPRQLEYLIGQEAGASDTGNAASGGDRAGQPGADESGGPWLVGIGAVAAVAVASVILAIARSRRQAAVTPAPHERDKLQV
jgi:hypothetical protein